jgi:AcrR family transcriptional regulator
VTTRAGVSESVFYDIFASLEECYRAAYEQGLRRLSQTVAQAVRHREHWLERVRCGLVAMLGFFEDEPRWARLLVLETSVSGPVIFDCRRRLHGLLGSLVDAGSGIAEHHLGAVADGAPMPLPALTGELVVGGVFSVIRTSMLEGADCGLVGLAPQLMSFIVRPYLGQAAARAELAGTPQPVEDDCSPAAQLPVRPTRRTLLVLRAIARAPRSNNREVALAAGVTDEGQASKLLARLERCGVIENVGIGALRGEPNAWLLTSYGQSVVERIGEYRAVEGSRAADRVARVGRRP